MTIAASINYGCAYTSGTRHAIPPTPRRGNRSPATTLCRLQCVVAEVCAIFSECRLYLHERQGQSTIIITRPLFDCTHNAWLDLSLSVQFVYNARLYNWVRRIMRSLERRVPLIMQCYARCCTLHSRISRMYSLPWRPTSVAEAGMCGIRPGYRSHYCFARFVCTLRALTAISGSNGRLNSCGYGSTALLADTKKDIQ